MPRTMKMKEWSLGERPREKMLERGPESLSHAELLAILMRTGTGKKNVVEIAQELLQAADGSLVSLSSLEIGNMQAVDGIGPDKAVTVTAAFELGRRLMEERSRLDGLSITHARMIYRLMIPRLKGLTHEEMWAIYLNRANYVLGKERLSSGSGSSTSSDLTTLLRHALDRKCSSVVIVHNHPSGNPVPGRSDLRETARIKEALGSLGLCLMDHVVVSDDKYYSFTDERVYLAEDF